MNINEMKLGLSYIVFEMEELSKVEKLQLISYIKEANETQLRVLAIDGEIISLEESESPLVEAAIKARFENATNVIESIATSASIVEVSIEEGIRDTAKNLAFDAEVKRRALAKSVPHKARGMAKDVAAKASAAKAKVADKASAMAHDAEVKRRALAKSVPHRARGMYKGAKDAAGSAVQKIKDNPGKTAAVAGGLAAAGTAAAILRARAKKRAAEKEKQAQK